MCLYDIIYLCLYSKYKNLKLMVSNYNIYFNNHIFKNFDLKNENTYLSYNKIVNNCVKYNTSQITIYKNNEQIFEISNKNHPLRIETMSVTKSICALSVLFLIQDGLISNINDKLSLYFNEWTYDKRKNISIKEVLSMTAQLENKWDYDKFMFPDGDYKKDKPPRYKYKRPNVNRIARNIAYSNHKSIGDFEYNNICSQTIPSLVFELVGIQIDKYLEDKLFKPLNIKIEWNKDDDGNPYGPNGVRINADDLCKIGLLILNKGKFLDNRIINSELINIYLENYVVNMDSLKNSQTIQNIKEYVSISGYGLSNWQISSNNSKNICMFMGFMGQCLIIDFDNRIVASKLNWCDYEVDDFNKNERKIYNEFIDEYII